MTDDIVTRLREEGWVWVSESALRDEAADEIERLRNDLAEARYEYQKLWDRTHPDYLLGKLQ